MPVRRVVETLTAELTDRQRDAVSSKARRLLVVAGAGSGKTEVMARRVAWWVGVDGVPRDQIVAFTFTEAAAEELKFRIRKCLQKVALDPDDTSLGGLYVGTIHGFCLAQLRKLKPAVYHNYDILDEAGRLALVQQGSNAVLALGALRSALEKQSRDAGRQYPPGAFEAGDRFVDSYDLLNEYDLAAFEVPDGTAPDEISHEKEWVKRVRLLTPVGDDAVSQAFAESAARYYGYLRCRRFLDFSTSQAELIRLLRSDDPLLAELRERVTHLVVDEVQDINPVQDTLIQLVVGEHGHLTAVGDHRQSIYAFRASRVDIMGRLHDDLVQTPDDGEVIELQENFRSTPRIVETANDWADTISPVRGLRNPRMAHGKVQRADWTDQHAALLAFDTREEEASWIASTIDSMVKPSQGAKHDHGASHRGIGFSDIAILLCSTTNAKTYVNALRERNIPAVVRGGPDLFSQPEVLLFLGALSVVAGIDKFLGSPNRPSSLPARCRQVLSCEPTPIAIIRSAAAVLSREGLPLAQDLAERLESAALSIAARLDGESKPAPRSRLRAAELRAWLDSGERRSPRRRVFPQQLLQFLLAEAEIGSWPEGSNRRGDVALFHLGQFSSLVKGMETPGWVPRDGLKYRVLALGWWGSQNARTDQGPLLVAPDAVTVSTIHSAKGLEWPALFLADVTGGRFPSNYAKRVPELCFNATTAGINAAELADNDNYDNERRLMYVALTRAERYLYATYSGSRCSSFVRKLRPIFEGRGARTFASDSSTTFTPHFEYANPALDSRARLATSFSELRYYVECPHDFYLRKVLGFAPGIDESFGYGRGVHNLLREIHGEAKRWAAMGKTERLQSLDDLIERGLMYLRYTTGDPADAMKAKGKRVVADYVDKFAGELERLEFEPEREFETLLPEAEALISGSIDVVRLDSPPRVTIIDFKSGHAESDARTALTEDLMRLQISLYALAAKNELEYQPERGLVRYLDAGRDDKHELEVPLAAQELASAKQKIIATVKNIRSRRFHEGPTPPRPGDEVRCVRCDFCQWCGRGEAVAARAKGARQ